MSNETTKCDEPLTAQEQSLMDLYKESPKMPDKKCVFIVAGESGSFLAAMDESRKLTIGANYKPDVAAQEFWNAVVKNNPMLERMEQLYKEIDRLKIECYDLRRINMEIRREIESK